MRSNRSGAAALPAERATIRFAARPPANFDGDVLESQPMPGQTTEQKIRGGDATAGWIGLFDPAGASALAAHGTIGIYRLSHSLTA